MFIDLQAPALRLGRTSLVHTPAASVMLRRRHQEDNRSTIYLPGLALDAGKPTVLFDNEIVPDVVAKRRQNLLPAHQQSRHYLRLRDISYRFAIPEMPDWSIHYSTGEIGRITRRLV